MIKLRPLREDRDLLLTGVAYTSPARVDDDYVCDQGAGLPVMLQDVRTPSTGSASTTTYLYGLGLISETVGSTTHFYLADGLGSTTEVVEDDGDVANTYRYDVWGALRSSSGSVTNQFDFTGEQADHNANRGLVYLRARHYDPTLGRFLSRDPLPTGNRYSYVGNNPTNFIDPLGLKCKKSSILNPTQYNDCVQAAVGEVVDYGGDVLRLHQALLSAVLSGSRAIRQNSHGHRLQDQQGVLLRYQCLRRSACSGYGGSAVLLQRRPSPVWRNWRGPQPAGICRSQPCSESEY